MFTLGFKKIATFSHNNQGLEFQMADDGTWAEKGMIPRQSDAPAKKEKKKPTPEEVAHLMMHKGASFPSDVMPDLGTRSSTGEENQFTGHKHDHSTPEMEQNSEINKRKKERRRALRFIRSGLK